MFNVFATKPDACDAELTQIDATATVRFPSFFGGVTFFVFIDLACVCFIKFIMSHIIGFYITVLEVHHFN